MDINQKGNLVIENGKLRLRELRDNDCEKIVKIVRAFSIVATVKLFIAYTNNKSFKHTMRDMNENGLFEKLLDDFKRLEKELAQKKIVPNTIDCENFITEILSNFPDDHLFSPYGPIQVPFDKSVKEFIETAKDARELPKETAKDTREPPKRYLFRMGIEFDGKLIGCFTIDFTKRKTLGYYKETFGDPGIFIDPDYRKIKDIGTEPVWKYVFSLAASFVEEYYPFKDESIPISATTHRLNQETGGILCKANGFTEYNGLVLVNYGERRFFTISYTDFIREFKLDREKQRGKTIICTE
jgi:hypothetical protein